MVAKQFLVKPPAIYEIELRIELRVEGELKPPARPDQDHPFEAVDKRFEAMQSKMNYVFLRG